MYYTTIRERNLSSGEKRYIIQLTMKGLLITLGMLGVGSVLPIWRGAGNSRHDGISFWRLVHDSTHLTPESPFGHPHLPYGEAARQASEAYQMAKESCGT